MFESIARPALASFYANAGHFLSVAPLDEWSARLAENFFRGFHLARVAGSPAKNSYSIRIRSTESLPSVPIGLDCFEVAQGHCHTDGYSFFLEIEDSLILVHPEMVMDVWVGASIHARQSPSLMSLMAYVLEIALRRCGLYEIHGAGVVEPQSNWSALFLGASGSGKSTLAALLASSGWKYLTDDTLLLKEDDGKISARGLRKSFALSEQTVAACQAPDLRQALRNPVSSDPSKRRLEPTVAFPGKWIESCVPQALFFAFITNEAESKILSLRPSEAMVRLIRFNPWASYDKVTGPHHLRVLNRLVNQCRAYSLGAGLDILNDPSFAATLLAPLVRERSQRAGILQTSSS